jgi:hypothetical protein
MTIPDTSDWGDISFGAADYFGVWKCELSAVCGRDVWECEHDLPGVAEFWELWGDGAVVWTEQ